MDLNIRKYVPQSVSRQVGKLALQAQKMGPNGLFYVGVGGVVVTAVLASRATLKVGDVLDDCEGFVENAKANDHGKRELAHIYASHGAKVVTLYTPAVISGIVTVGCLTGSHKMLTNRNANLMAAYASVDTAFREYRARVIEDQGRDKDDEYRYGAEKAKVIDEKGNKVAVVRHKKPTYPTDHSMYARFFDQLNKNWSSEPEYNKVFLRCQQNYLNDMLRARGHVFLNEVYDALGIERTKAGAVVGWVISDVGDCYIDFGIFDGTSDRARAFVNGDEGSILLDFNVDGVIYDKI